MRILLAPHGHLAAVSAVNRVRIDERARGNTYHRCPRAASARSAAPDLNLTAACIPRSIQHGATADLNVVSDEVNLASMRA